MKFLRYFIRLFRKPLVLENLSTKPISKSFGLDRGTPIDRFYISAFLQKHSSNIHGVVLEISENTYSKKFNSGISSFEVLHYNDKNPKATIIGDLTDATTLPKEKIDCFICTQTLNFIFDVQKAIEGSYKLLKKDGVFLGTVSGISQISRYDMDRWGDYWRFTDLSIRKMFENTFGKGNVEVEIFGNVLAATSFLQGIAVEDISNIELLNDKDPDYQVILGIRAIKI